MATDAELFADLTGASVDWFEYRMPDLQKSDQWQEIRLFGHRWREPWLLRGTHQQICPVCLHEQGIARLEWDLVAYPVCHIHHVILQDSCGTCGRAIDPGRPSLHVCGCGAYIAAVPEPSAMTISPLAVDWATWLSQNLMPTLLGPEAARAELMAPQLAGTSPDGAFRLLHAFAGGIKAFRSAKSRKRNSWLRSQAVLQLLVQGIGCLTATAAGKFSGLQAGTSQALADQAAAGVTAWDRAAAAREMGRLRLGRRWANSVPRCSPQLDLFER